MSRDNRAYVGTKSTMILATWCKAAALRFSARESMLSVTTAMSWKTAMML